MRKIVFMCILLMCLTPSFGMDYSNSPLVSESCKAVEVSGSILYIGTEWGLMVYDVSDPGNPVEMHRLPVVLNNGGLNIVRKEEQFLFISGINGTGVYDLTDPIHPVLLYLF